MAGKSLRHPKPLFFKFIALALVLMIFQVSFFVEPLPVAATEEENIDDFAIHPAQRWNSIADEAEDVITGDSYEIYSLNNETEGNTEFVKSRGLRTQDMKVSSLLKVDTGGDRIEFSRDTLGNTWDFNIDGDQKGWTKTEGTATVSVSGGIMAITITGNSNRLKIDFLTGLIATDVYESFNIRIKADIIDANPFFTLRNLPTEQLVTTPVTFFTEEWQTFNFDLSDDPDWTGTLTGLRLQFDEADDLLNTGLVIYIEFIELFGDFDFATSVKGEIEDTWDWEEEDLEGWSGPSDGLADPDGFLLVENVSSAISDTAYTATVNIQTDFFEKITIRAKSNEANTRIQMRSGAVGIVTDNAILTTDFSIFTWVVGINLSDINYAGTLTDLLMNFREESGEGNFEGTEQFFVDYLLVEGNFSANDGFSLGLLNQDQEEAMSFKFTRNSTDNSEHELTISLWDASGAGFSSTTSFQYDQSVDGWLDLSFRLDTIEKQFKFDLDYENGTRIINIDRFSDIFTNLPVNILVFNTNGNMTLALNNTVGSLARSLVIIDFINADFSEREWKQTIIPSDSDYLADGNFIARMQDDISEESQYELSVPELDVVSGIMFANFTNMANLGVGEIAGVGFAVFGVDKDDGELHELISIVIILVNPGTNGMTIQISIDGVLAYDVTQAGDHNPAASFVMQTSNDRSVLTLRARLWADIGTEPIEYVASAVVADIVDVASQEFHLVTLYFGTFTGDMEFTASIESFTVLFRERWVQMDIPPQPDPRNPSGTSSGGGLSANPIIAALQIVGNLITAGIGGFVDALVVPAIAALGIILDTIFNVLGTIAGVLATIAETLAGLAAATATAIWESIGDALDFIVEAIVDISEGIWIAFSDVAGDLMDDIVTALIALAADVADLIGDVIDFLLPILTAIATDIADFLFAILEFVFVLLLTVFSEIWDIIVGIVFFVWDAFGLPDLIAILTFALTGITGIIGDAVANLQWFVDVLFTWGNGIFFLGVILLLAIPVFSSKGSGELMEKMVEANSWDILPIGVLGFNVHVPVGLVFWPLLFLVVFLL